MKKRLALAVIGGAAIIAVGVLFFGNDVTVRKFSHSDGYWQEVV